MRPHPTTRRASTRRDPHCSASSRRCRDAATAPCSVRLDRRDPRTAASSCEARAGVGWDEVAQVRLENGEIRHGVVLDVSGDLAVRRDLRGHGGHAHRRRCRSSSPERRSRSPSARPGSDASATAAGSRSTVGRRSSAASTATSPARRSIRPPRASPRDPIVTGISAIDGLAIAGPRAEAADLLGRRSPASRAREPDRGAGDRPATSRSPSCSPPWA